MGCGNSKPKASAQNAKAAAENRKAALARRRRVLLGEDADKGQQTPFERLDPNSMFHLELDKYEDDEVFSRMTTTVIEDFRKRADALKAPDGRLDRNTVCELLELGLPQDSEIGRRLFQLIHLHEDGDLNRNVTVYEVLSLFSILRAGEQKNFEEHRSRLRELCFCLFDCDGDDHVSAPDFAHTSYALIHLGFGVEGLVGQDLEEFKALTDDEIKIEALNVAKRMCFKYSSGAGQNQGHNTADTKDAKKQQPKAKAKQQPKASQGSPEPPKLTFEEWARWLDETINLAETFGYTTSKPELEQSTSMLLRHVGTALPTQIEMLQIEKDLGEAKADEALGRTIDSLELDNPDVNPDATIPDSQVIFSSSPPGAGKPSKPRGAMPPYEPLGASSMKDTGGDKDDFAEVQVAGDKLASKRLSFAQSPGSSPKGSKEKSIALVGEGEGSQPGQAATKASGQLDKSSTSLSGTAVESFRVSNVSDSDDDLVASDQKRKGFATANPTVRLSQLNNVIDQQLSGMSDTYGSASPIH